MDKENSVRDVGFSVALVISLFLMFICPIFIPLPIAICILAFKFGCRTGD
jgi:hypothetical protein